MATKRQEQQEWIRRYKQRTGKKEIDLHEVANWLKAQGWPMPKPIDPLDMLAKELAESARDEYRKDAASGRRYRANHQVMIWEGNKQVARWFDIDEKPPRKVMHKSLIQRREQMVGDGLQLTIDSHRWNSQNPTEEPIVVPLDITPDVEEALSLDPPNESVA
jgi:hypothetical protein